MDEKHIEEILTPLVEKEIDQATKSSDDKFLTIFSHPRVLVRFIILCLIQ